MKKALGAIAVAALLAACGNSPNNNNGTDSSGTLKSDSGMMQNDTTNMTMPDTMHKDSTVH